ncbi:TrkH family potassium uptake protein [Bifidobacterium leontopitheci]|uniref:Potassium transporter Trk n=1 Tax=Bifidobacterium leontopitheci TaxID=2650774 RepID=A0A6I1GJP0_9BIFI|nr:potassium transporter TrkG [Bifidobacterium leontopitheci]KAB7790952.1 potassium transporter Trk [Bifidobacterium leontopitheci]
MPNLVFDESSSNRNASHGYAWWFSGDTFEKAAAQERLPRKRSFIRHLTSHPGRLTIIYFMLLVVISTSLLTLPAASHGDDPTDFSTALFTAVSALSTCGISIVNATTHWTLFGQIVLLASVQMGGLGVMTFASLIALAVNHHIKASQRLLTANELGTTKLNEIRGVLTVVITTTFVIETITFLALFPGLLHVNKGNARHSAWEALFFAVMSYNNAGFTPDNAGLHVNNWAVGMPIMLSAFCGTLGFPVLLNLMRCIRHHTPPRRWSLHTKITLVTTFALVLLSLTWFLLVEWDNPYLFRDADVETRLRYGVVAAVMPRSSGFDLSWVPQVSEPTKVFMSAIMFIGGGSTSTAGGIRVTTFAVIMLVCRAAFTGHSDINAFHRRIHTKVAMTAVSITAACLMLVVTASLALMLVADCSLTDALFDACSSFGLGGYSVGVAREDNPAALAILATAMVVGRLGPMTIAYAISRPRAMEVVRYPTEPMVVG